MNWKPIACLVICLAVSFVVVFMLGGAFASAWSATRIGQIVLAAVAVFFGFVAGRALQKRI